jgi:hypothetical protein
MQLQGTVWRSFWAKMWWCRETLEAALIYQIEQLFFEPTAIAMRRSKRFASSVRV